MIYILGEELESNRQELIESNLRVRPNFLEISESDLGKHEALHTASIMMDSVDRHLADHPAILNDKEAYTLAYRAFENLFNLYQYLGSKE